MEYEKVERVEFVGNDGNDYTFKRVWGGYRFTDEEVDSLIAGDTITIKNLVSKSDNHYSAVGKLEEQEYLDNFYWGFKMLEYIDEEKD